MRGLFFFGALAAVVSGAVVHAAERLSVDEIEWDKVPGNEPFFFYMMTEESNDLNRIRDEVDSKLALAKRNTREEIVDDSLRMLRTCFSKAPLMNRYVVLRPEPENKEEDSSLMGASSKVREKNLDWGVFRFTFGTGGNRLSYVEDLAWAVKNVVDIFDNTPLCKDEISKKEGRLTRWSRKLVRGKWTRREFVENFLGWALHKAFFDWASNIGVPNIFSGEEIPLLIATAREANAKASKLTRLDKKLKSQKYLNSKVHGMRSVVASHYLSHLGRAFELMQARLWDERDAPPSGSTAGSSTEEQAGSEDKLPSTPSGSVGADDDAPDVKNGEAAAKESKGGASYYPESSPSAQVATQALVSSRLFMILTKSKYAHVAKMINDTALGIGDEVLGDTRFGHAIVPMLPCPSRGGKLVDAAGEKFFILRKNVWVFKFHGLVEGKLEIGSRNPEAEQALLEVLKKKDTRFLTHLFGTKVTPEDLDETYIKGLFPTMCFKNLKQAREYLQPMGVSGDNVKSVLTEVSLWGMSRYASTMKKIARVDKEKVEKDVTVRAGKMLRLKAFLWGLLKTTGIIFAIGVSMVLLVCAIAVSAAVTPVGGIPACLAAAVLFGGPMWFVVASALTFAAVGLGGFAFAASAGSSIESALRFVITPLVEAKKRELQVRRAQRSARRAQLGGGGEMVEMDDLHT